MNKQFDWEHENGLIFCSGEDWNADVWVDSDESNPILLRLQFDFYDHRVMINLEKPYDVDRGGCFDHAMTVAEIIISGFLEKKQSANRPNKECMGSS